MSYGSNLFDLVGEIQKGPPSLQGFGNLFAHIGTSVGALAKMINNTVNTLKLDISGQITKLTVDLNKLAVSNATYITNKALGKNVSGMPSIETLVQEVNKRVQDEIRLNMKKIQTSIFKGPLAALSGGGGDEETSIVTHRNNTTRRAESHVHRTKTHRRSATSLKV
jgi:hypothetical protein